MAEKEKLIIKGYEYARELYADIGVDTDSAIKAADSVALSMQCWQGDDVIGFDGTGELSGGIATTGSYPGRARTPAELRADIDMARSLIPGEIKLNLHASYAEKNGKKIDRDQYGAEQFQSWIDWAVENSLGLDFNPTFFSHAKMDGDFSLSSLDEAKRRFWVEHGKRCREIALDFAHQTGKRCVVNYWMPDGMKDSCADTLLRREIMTRSLDEIFSADIDESLVPCAIESKLFGVGLESYTVASHEYALGYAISNKKLYCLDAGHFHPTETVSAKISACLCWLDKLLLHISRGVRWDSDHVVALDDELQRIMDEIVWNGFLSRVYIGLDYFDASINRIACWVIGMRNARKALLSSFLSPYEKIRKAEREGDYTARFSMQEDRRTLPLGAVWDYYCLTKGIAQDYLSPIREYEKTELSKRV